MSADDARSTSGPGAAPRDDGRLPAAVLWDMDGTLVDTEPYWIECEYALVAEHGGRWSDADARSLVGSSLLVAAAYIREHGGVDLPPEVIVDRLVDEVVERVRRHVPFRPGARELLDELRQHDVPCALVTMSYRRLALAVTGAVSEGSFDVVVAGDDVSQGKPHPEPYLRAAAELGVDPAACVAIEDSPPGVASAVAAGVPTLAVEHLVPLAPGPGRTVVTSLAGWRPTDLVTVGSTTA